MYFAINKVINKSVFGYSALWREKYKEYIITLFPYIVFVKKLLSEQFQHHS